MAWVKIDDGFAWHPKAMRAEAEAPSSIALWVAGACYCARYGTDGRLEPFMLTALPFWSTERRDALVRSGLWLVAEDGAVTFHDWLKYQISKAESEEHKARSAARVAAHRSRNASGNALQTPVTGGVSNGVSSGLDLSPRREERPSPARSPGPTTTTPAPPGAVVSSVADLAREPPLPVGPVRAVAILREYAAPRLRLPQNERTATGLSPPQDTVLMAVLQAYRPDEPWLEACARLIGGGEWCGHLKAGVSGQHLFARNTGPGSLADALELSKPPQAPPVAPEPAWVTEEKARMERWYAKKEAEVRARHDRERGGNGGT